jgi:hypothetical protein
VIWIKTNALKTVYGAKKLKSQQTMCRLICFPRKEIKGLIVPAITKWLRFIFKLVPLLSFILFKKLLLNDNYFVSYLLFEKFF